MRCQSMADSFRAEIQGPPNGFRAGAFASVGRKSQALIFGIGVLLAKELGRGFLLVASNADANHVAIAIFCCQLDDFLCRLGTELAYGVEDPEQTYVEVFLSALAAALQAFEDGVEVLLAPEAHTYGNVNLGVEDVLGLQLLH